MANEVAFYSPDTDPTIPGTLTDVMSLVPSLKGYKSANSATESSLPALADQCFGAASLKRLDGVTRVIAGTETGLYEASTGSWIDVTRLSGPYALTSDSRWCFAQYGNTSLAATKAEPIQFSDSGEFDDIASAPNAAVIDVVNNFAFAANTSDAIYGDSPDRVWWSALGDYSDWTPSATTQAGTTRVTSRAGKVTAIKRFGSSMIAYKVDSMYIGTYVGAPLLWDFQDIQGEIGAICQNVVVNVGTPEYPRHIFMGATDFYQFGGGTPTPIGSPLKETVFNEVNNASIENSYAMHDRINSRVYFFYPSGGSTLPDKCVVYNYKTNKWGRDDRQIECATEFVTPAMTYGDLGTFYSTYADLPLVSYGSSIFSTSSDVPAIFGEDHKLYTLNGAPLGSSFTTGDYGDEINYVLLKRIKPQFITAPSTATMTNYYRDSLGAELISDQIVSMSNYRFDLLRSARWHRITISMNGDAELNTLAAIFKGNGLE